MVALCLLLASFGLTASSSAAVVYFFMTPYLIGQAQLPGTFTVGPQVFDQKLAYTVTVDNVAQPGVTVVDERLVFTASPSCGFHIARVYPPAPPSGYAPQPFYFYVACIAIKPVSIRFGAQPAPITVTGVDFPTGFDITAAVDGKAVALNPNRSVVASEGDIGTIAGSQLLADGLGCGNHTVIVTETYQPDSTSPVTATISASAALAVTDCPVITANPSVITEGTLTKVSGSGFIPNKPVALTWQTNGGVTLAACSPNTVSAPVITADASGAVNVFCLAKLHEILGAGNITAVQGAASAAAPVVLQGGSMQPSNGDQFVFRR